MCNSRVRTGWFVWNYRLCPIYIGFPEPKYRPNIGFGSLRDQIGGKWRGHWSREFVISRVFFLFLFFFNQIHILCQRLTDTGKIPGITLAASWASISIWGQFFSLQETAPFSQIPPSALFHLFWTSQHLRAKKQLGQCLWNSRNRQPSSFYRSLLEVEYLLLFSFLFALML